MFESLSAKLQKITASMRGKARVTEQDIKDMMREIRMALLEADVNYSVVKSFVAEMTEKCKNADIEGSFTPGQQIVKIVHESLVELLGTGEEKLAVNPSGFTVVILYGLQGAGKTTTAVKLAKLLKAAGTSFDKVVKTTCFLADMADFAAFNEIYANYFVGKPARSCVAVKTLPKNVLCEVEVIASLK